MHPCNHFIRVKRWDGGNCIVIPLFVLSIVFQTVNDGLIVKPLVYEFVCFLVHIAFDVISSPMVTSACADRVDVCYTCDVGFVV
jgi:uncharacterized membrane protein YhdT